MSHSPVVNIFIMDQDLEIVCVALILMVVAIRVGGRGNLPNASRLLGFLLSSANKLIKVLGHAVVISYPISRVLSY